MLSICVQILKLIKNNYLGFSPTKNGFFEIHEVKIWYQPNKNSDAGWMDGWVGRKAILRIAYSNQKLPSSVVVLNLWGEAG